MRVGCDFVLLLLLLRKRCLDRFPKRTKRANGIGDTQGANPIVSVDWSINSVTFIWGDPVDDVA